MLKPTLFASFIRMEFSFQVISNAGDHERMCINGYCVRERPHMRAVTRMLR